MVGVGERTGASERGPRFALAPDRSQHPVYLVPMFPFLRRTLHLLARAFVLRCPECGSRGLFASWFRMKDACPGCGLRLNRGERGYQVGSYMLNIIAAELIFIAIFLGIIFATWPSPPWDLLQYGGALLMVLAPALLYPFTKTVFLAMDLAVRPADTPIEPEVR